jgi:hypothetical protein
MLNINTNLNAAASSSSEALIHSPHLSPHSLVASAMPTHPPPPPPPVYLPASAASLIALAKTATQSSSEVHAHVHSDVDHVAADEFAMFVSIIHHLQTKSKQNIAVEIQ